MSIDTCSKLDKKNKTRKNGKKEKVVDHILKVIVIFELSLPESLFFSLLSDIGVKDDGNYNNQDNGDRSTSSDTGSLQHYLLP